MAGRKQKKIDWKQERLINDLENNHNSDFHHSLYDLINLYEHLPPRVQDIAEKSLCEKWNVPYQNIGLIKFLDSMIFETFNFASEKESKFIYKNLPPMILKSYKSKKNGEKLRLNDPLTLDLINRAYISLVIGGEYDPTQNEKVKLGYIKTVANSAIRDYFKQAYQRHENSTENIDDFFTTDSGFFASNTSSDIDDESSYGESLNKEIDQDNMQIDVDEDILEDDSQTSTANNADENASADIDENVIPESTSHIDQSPSKKRSKFPILQPDPTTARPTIKNQSHSATIPNMLIQFTYEHLIRLEEIDDVIKILANKMRRTYKGLTSSEPEDDLIKGLIKEAADFIRRSKKFKTDMSELERSAFLETLSKNLVKEYVKSVNSRAKSVEYKKRSKKAG